MGGKNSRNLRRAKTRKNSIENDEEIKNELLNPIKFVKYKEIEELGNTFKKLEKKKHKINYLNYMDFNDYMISLSNFTLKNADLKDDYSSLKYKYSYRDKFYNETFNIEYLQSFIEAKILKHPNIYEKALHSENSQERTLLFKDFLFNLQKCLIPKVKEIELENGVSEDELNENTIMKKSSAIVYGLLYCGGEDWVKAKIFFNLFKEDGKLKKSEFLDLFLFMLFTTATYATCYSRTQLCKYKMLGDVNQEYLSDILKLFQIDVIKSVVEYTDKLLFGKEQNSPLLYEQFRERCQISDKNDTLSFLFSPRGIRYMHRRISGVVLDKKKLKRSITKK